MIHPALPGEGVWHADAPGPGRAPPLLVTTLRDEPDYPRVVVGLAWIDTKRTQISLYPGRIEPSVALPPRADGGAAGERATACSRRSTAASSSATHMAATRFTATPTRR